MSRLREWVGLILRPGRKVRAAQARLDDDREQLAELTDRMDRSAKAIHHQVHVGDDISAAVAALLRGKS